MKIQGLIFFLSKIVDPRKKKGIRRKQVPTLGLTKIT